MQREINTRFDHNHYVPVLRCKEAEKKALIELDHMIRAKMTPLIEIPRSFKEKVPNPKNPEKEIEVLLDRYDPKVPALLDKLLQKTTADIKTVWWNRPFFLDLHHLYPEWRLPNGAHPVTAWWRYARNCLYPPVPIPVVTLGSDVAFREAVQEVLSHKDSGIAIRLEKEEFSNLNLSTRLTTLLNSFNLGPEQVDLLVDFGVVGKDQLDLELIFSRVPWIKAWRTFTCVSGSFRKDLSGLEPGEYEFDRWEWQAFLSQVSQATSWPRIPTYSDYATQHAEYSDPIPGAQPTASIRYTADNEFVVVRGQRLDRGAKYMQYPANAMSLCARPEFGTIVSCAGDRYVSDIASRMAEIELAGKGTGNTTTWIQASLNRHWSVTVKQVSDLFAP